MKNEKKLRKRLIVKFAANLHISFTQNFFWGGTLFFRAFPFFFFYGGPWKKMNGKTKVGSLFYNLSVNKFRD